MNNRNSRYTTSRTIEIDTLSRPSPSTVGPAATSKAAGRINAIAASVSIVAWVPAPAGLKCCSGYRIPPASMAAPSTSRILPIMQPAIDASTTSWSPARNAARAIMSSAALPNVALSSPPTPSPMRSARCSVARPIQAASGTIARAEVMKTRRYRSGASSSCPIATGINNKSQFIIMDLRRPSKGFGPSGPSARHAMVLGSDEPLNHWSLLPWIVCPIQRTW